MTVGVRRPWPTAMSIWIRMRWIRVSMRYLTTNKYTINIENQGFAQGLGRNGEKKGAATNIGSSTIGKILKSGAFFESDVVKTGGAPMPLAAKNDKIDVAVITEFAVII